jgi:hypothetical protein
MAFTQQETITQVVGPNGEMETSVSDSPNDAGCMDDTSDGSYNHPASMHDSINRTISDHY